jgi:RNA polymerase sigma-70 factor (ECF subfamily)
MATPALLTWPLAQPMERANFQRLFAEHAPYVGRTLRYLGVAEADLEDGCQEVFIVVHRRLGELVHVDGARAWIRKICVHVSQNIKRTARRRREHTSDVPVIAAAATQHAHAERNQTRERLLAILDQLSEDQREVFVLYELEQLTMADVASAAGCPLQTAYSRLHAARTHVEQAMKQSEVVS